MYHLPLYGTLFFLTNHAYYCVFLIFMFACWRVLFTINSYMIEIAIPSSRHHFYQGQPTKRFIGLEAVKKLGSTG